MHTYQQAQQAAKQQAEQWLEDHKSELSDVTCHEQSYAERQGYEVLGQVLQDIAQDEAAQSDFWIDSEDSDLVAAGQFNVVNCKHWIDVQEYDETGKPVGTRFNGEEHAKHTARQSKARARFNIEYCYTKGKIRAKLPKDLKAVEIKIKAKKIKTKLSALDRRLAAVAARNARKS